MLARPIEHVSPAWGQRVGGVSGRPTRETERSDPFACPPSRRWKAPRFTGRRQPSRAAGRTRVLVGPLFRVQRVPPLHAGAPATKGVLWIWRRGTSSACARRTHSTRRRPTSALVARGHVLRSVQRPVHVDRHSLLCLRKETRRWKHRQAGGGAAFSVSRSGKPAKAGGTGTGAELDGRKRGSPRVTESERILRDASEPGRWSRPSS